MSDPTFNPTDQGYGQGDGIEEGVHAMARLASGQFLLGGQISHFGGVPVQPLIRVTADGWLDPDFDSGAGVIGPIYAIVPLDSGKVLLGGALTMYDGVARSGIAMIDQEGQLDASYATGSGVSSGYITDIVVQPDGRAIVAGYMEAYDGVTCGNICRLDLDGSLDTTFQTGAGFNSHVNALALQEDGRILVGGYFNAYDGVSCPKICRLNTDGSVDTTFHPGSGFLNSQEVWTILVLPNDRIVIGGDFTSYDGEVANRMVQLHPDGSRDASVDMGTGFNGAVYALELAVNGDIWAAGSFFTYDGQSAGKLARLNGTGSMVPLPGLGTSLGP